MAKSATTASDDSTYGLAEYAEEGRDMQRSRSKGN